MAGLPRVVDLFAPGGSPSRVVSGSVATERDARLDIEKATWRFEAIDTAMDIGIYGQFDPKVSWPFESPNYTISDGVAGGPTFAQHTGHKPGILKFELHFVAMDREDARAANAITSLQEMCRVDRTLGRPPRVRFTHGGYSFEGKIVSDHSSMPTKTFYKTAVIRELGPIEVSVYVDSSQASRSTSTAYVVNRGQPMEEISKEYYGTTDFAFALLALNQWVPEGGEFVLPARDAGKFDKDYTSPYLR